MAKRVKKAPAKRKNYKSGTRSTDFKVDERTQKKYLVVAPGKLWKRVQAKAKGVISVRALILGLLTDWVDGKIVYPRPEAITADDLGLGHPEPSGSPSDINH